MKHAGDKRSGRRDEDLMKKMRQESGQGERRMALTSALRPSVSP